MTLPLALLGLGLLLSPSARAGELREPVLTLLSGVEDPPDAQSLQRLGAGVGDELLEIAQDGEVARTRRARAVHALGWFPSDASRSFLDQTLASSDRLLSRKAAFALATGWGDGAVPLLTQALSDEDTQLRIASAQALGLIGSDAARAALRGRLSAETNENVQSTIQSALAN